MEVLNGHQFSNEVDYFRQVVDLLSKYNWIYKSPNTHILVDDILSHIPGDWIPHLSLDKLSDVEEAVKGEIQSMWPDEMQNFVRQCWSLSLKSDVIAEKADGGDEKRKWVKVNPKKVHEVQHFAHFISDECRKDQVEHVVDIGAGLGYLDKELSERYQLKVLGLERDAYRVSAANERSQSTATECHFKELNVHDSLDSQVETVVSQWSSESSSSPICMIGLHSCGDLSPSMIRLFLGNRRFRSLFLISCCYHRMDCLASNPNFPLSECFKTLEGNALPGKESLPFFLRLASQETPRLWIHHYREHGQRQIRSTFYRSVLQRYAANEGIQLFKQYRKAVKIQAKNDGFEEYAAQAVEGFGLKGDAQTHRNKLTSLYHQYEPVLPSIETLIVFQALLQPVAEAMVLVDRVAHLRENGIVGATLKKIFDDKISPRCFVLEARKPRIH